MTLDLRILYFEDLSVGMTETLSKTIASSDVVGFAQLTGDRNPIHLSEHFAAKTQFGSRIAHGLYTASLISAVLGTRLPGPGAVYRSQTLNFLGPVKIGDVVTITVEVIELVPEGRKVRLHCDASVDGKTVLDGEAIVSVPGRRAALRCTARDLTTRSVQPDGVDALQRVDAQRASGDGACTRRCGGIAARSPCVRRRTRSCGRRCSGSSATSPSTRSCGRGASAWMRPP